MLPARLRLPTVLEDLGLPGWGVSEGEAAGGEGCDDDNRVPGVGIYPLPDRGGAGVTGWRRQGGEQCDDGNRAAWDGCHANCQIEGQPGAGNGCRWDSVV